MAIVGSRDFGSPDLVRRFVAGLPPGTVVVSGGARGVDTWAEDAAKANGLETKVFKADWDTLGKRAGYVRNLEIVAYCDKVVAFWDGLSRGTKHTMDAAERAGKPLETVFHVKQVKP